MEKLKGKVAIVTGGSSGIGKEIALKFAFEGANVIIIGRHEDTLKELVLENDNISYVVGDMTDENTIKKIIEKVDKEYHGRLDILVNNAGWCPVKSIKEMIIEDYDKAFDLDVKAVVHLTINALPYLLKSKGSILNLSSVGATHPSPNLSMYVGAKAAIENFTKVWALDLATDGVRVNAIAPGAIESNIWNVPGMNKEDAKKHEEGIASTIPVKRFGVPEEVANVALFLVSDEASYVTGSIYAVDGGMGAI